MPTCTCGNGSANMQKLTKRHLKEWEKFKQEILSHSTVYTESPAERKSRLDEFRLDYNAFCRYYFPHYTDSDCAGYHLEAAETLLQNPTAFLFMVVYRGGAKSVHANLMIPLWLLFFHNELSFMLLVGETEQKACMLLRDIQLELQFNQRLIADFGEQMQQGDWADGEFKIRIGTFFKAIGIRQSARGLRNQADRPDYVSVDDCDSRKTALNQEITAERCDKVLGDIAGAFAKDRGRMIVSNNLIHKKGLLAHLLAKMQGKPQTHLIRADALEPSGKPTWNRFTADYWQAKKAAMPSAQWEREYMNNPVEEGLIFQAEWMQWKPLPILKHYNKLLCYGDLSYKAQGDYKALVLLGKSGNEFHVLDAFVRKTTLQNVIGWCYDLRASVPQDITLEFQMEASFMQDMFLDAFHEEGGRRGFFLNIRGDKRAKPEKFTRIESLTPLFQKGQIYFNQDKRGSADLERLIEQLLMFERGSSANDDAPDALEGAVHLLNKQTRFTAFPSIFLNNNRKNAW
jgi:predicted phage terminase large subunit-like protein